MTCVDVQIVSSPLICSRALKAALSTFGWFAAANHLPVRTAIITAWSVESRAVAAAISSGFSALGVDVVAM